MTINSCFENYPDFIKKWLECIVYILNFKNYPYLERKLNYLSIQHSAMQEEYLGILIYLIFAIFLSCFIIALSYLLVAQNPETEKLSTYECGFEPYGDTRNQFNIKFYIIAILFILFDIEIIFLLPWCVSISQLNLLGFWSMIEFLIELSVGFIYAWSVGALEWN
jgi:NADH-quinone oxidoreductase subunit A